MIPQLKAKMVYADKVIAERFGKFSGERIYFDHAFSILMPVIEKLVRDKIYWKTLYAEKLSKNDKYGVYFKNQIEMIDKSQNQEILKLLEGGE